MGGLLLPDAVDSRSGFIGKWTRSCFVLFSSTPCFHFQFGGSEAIITALSDEFPILRRHRELFVAVLFAFYFIIGIPSCTDAGVYFVELLQNYAGKTEISAAEMK